MSLRNLKPHRLSKSYAATFTSVANLDSTPTGTLRYAIVGRQVRVSGEISADPTAGATLTRLGISLPFGFDVVNTTDVSGGAHNQVAQNGEVTGDTTNNRAELAFTSSGTAVETWQVHFSYQMAR